MLIKQVSKRIDGIAGFWHMELNIRCPEVIMVPDGQFNHPQTVEFMQKRTSLFEGILGTDDKPYFIQVCLILHDIGDDQVPDMDWIKGSKKKTDFQNLRVLQELIDQFFGFSKRGVNVVVDQDNIKLIFK